MIKKGHKRGTILHGICSSEHLDSSGERIKIEGVDISSLTLDGTANWEHKSEESSQTVGKIIESKKILKRSDCENEHHEYFWDKVKMPYIYSAIELFDEEGHEGAKSIAAMARYDQKTDKRSTKNLINFSIEGSRLDKDGSNILKCIARKIAITVHPCNKVCEAEIKNDNKNSLLESIIGKSENYNCEIMKSFPKYSTSLIPKKQKEGKTAGYVPPNKHAIGAENHKEGTPTKPKRSFEAGKESKDWQVGDRTIYPNKKPKTGTEIYGKMPKIYNKSMGKSKEMTVDTKEMVEEHKKVVDVLESPSHKDDKKEAKKQKKELKGYKDKLKKKSNFYDSNVKKALTAGSGMSAPAQKEGGSALSGEHVEKEMHKLMDKSVSKSSDPKGGSIIGSTGSGKPIYNKHDHPSHSNFSKEDHLDAAKAHRNSISSKQSSRKMESTRHQEKMHSHKAREEDSKTAKKQKSKQEQLDAAMASINRQFGKSEKETMQMV